MPTKGERKKMFPGGLNFFPNNGTKQSSDEIVQMAGIISFPRGWSKTFWYAEVREVGKCCVRMGKVPELTQLVNPPFGPDQKEASGLGI